MRPEDDKWLLEADCRARGYWKARTTPNKWCKAGRFPEPEMYIGGKRAWRLSTVLKWEREQMARTAAERSAA